MSLEAELSKTNELLAAILVVLQTGVSAAQLNTNATSETKTTGRKRGPGVTDDGNVYWDIPNHKTVYIQKAGDAAPQAEGAIQVPKEVYDAKKAQYEVAAKNGQSGAATSQNANASASGTATGSSGTSTGATEQKQNNTGATTQTSASATSASDGVSFDKIVDAAKAVNASDKAGCGREGLMKVLTKFLPNDDKPSVTKLQPLGQNSAILAAFNELLNPPAAAEFDPLA
jgi:cobalamin biosynthesis Mg chelatase CobN